MASPVEKSTGDATFQNWRAAGETSRLFRTILRHFVFHARARPPFPYPAVCESNERLGASLTFAQKDNFVKSFYCRVTLRYST